MDETNTKTFFGGSWWPIAIASFVVFVFVLWLFRSTAMSMVEIWSESETFAHGFLILPISLWLVWHKRAHLAAFSPTPAPLLLVAVAGGVQVAIGVVQVVPVGR